MQNVEIIELSATDPDPALAADAGVSLVGVTERRAQAPDRSLVLARQGSVMARLSCWWNATPMHEGHNLGVIGHYAAGSLEAGTYLLERACDLLTARGRRLAVGPMDGNTWRRYRFVVERGAEPPFALEPDNPDEWSAHWTTAGFAEMATYASAMNDTLGEVDARTDRSLDRLASHGIRITTLDLDRVELTLERIYQLSVSAFTANFLYTPIGRDEFIGQYRAVLPYVRATAARYALAEPWEGTEISLCPIDRNPVSLGAATLVLEGFLS